MNYNGRHRNDERPGAVPRRSLLLGGILAAGAAFGLHEVAGGPSTEPVANRTATGADPRRARTSRERASRDRRRDGGPNIRSTDEWGAGRPDRDAEVLSRAPKYLVVHHTFTENTGDRSLGQARRLARSVQDFHMEQGWGDTGQHFTVSRGGHILEGRHGSLKAAERGEMVRGTHVSGANGFTVGIECEGTYNSVMPPDELRDSLVELLAWLCTRYDLDPQDAIVPHMRFNDTDCCGYEFAPTLPSVRDDVAALL